MSLAHLTCGLALLACASPPQGPRADLQTSQPTSAQEAAAPAAPGATPRDAVRAGRVAAAAPGHEVSWALLDVLLLDRYALAEEGKQAVLFLAKSLVLEELMAERGIDVTEHELAARFAELDREIRAGGGAGLAAELEANGVPRARFIETLRLAIAQERLARAALGIPEDRPIDGDAQELWLTEVLGERGVDRLPPPWDDGVAARVGASEITTDELARTLRAQLPAADLREMLFQLLLERSLRERMSPIEDADLTRHVEREIDRRRREAAADPAYSGVPFEDLLAARGRTVAGLARDPAVRVRALVELYLERSASGEALRERYLAERGRFDDLFGEAVRGRVLYLRGDEAVRVELEHLLPSATSEQAFVALVAGHARDPELRARGGDLGFVTRATPDVDPAIREALFDASPAPGPAPDPPRVLGPLRVADGWALVWVGAHRPTPPFEELAPQIRAELSRRLLENTLAPQDVATFVDPLLGG